MRSSRGDAPKKRTPAAVRKIPDELNWQVYLEPLMRIILVIVFKVIEILFHKHISNIHQKLSPVNGNKRPIILHGNILYLSGSNAGKQKNM